MNKAKIKFTIYSKTKYCKVAYCDYYYYDYNNYKKGTTRAGGYGYDKWSTALSKAINLFTKEFKRKTRGKNCKPYGLDNDNKIDYGIGFSAVINCLKAFSNVKVLSIYEGKNEDCLIIEVKNE